MAQLSFWDRVREWIGGIAWDVFLWSARMTEDEYLTALTRDVELRHEAVEVGQICPTCDGEGQFYKRDDLLQCTHCNGTGQI